LSFGFRPRNEAKIVFTLIKLKAREISGVSLKTVLVLDELTHLAKYCGLDDPTGVETVYNV